MNTHIRDAIDRNGPDFDNWRDPALARESRRAILADRALRAHYDDAVTLWDGLAGARAAADAEVATSGGVARIEGALIGGVPRRRSWRSRWIAIAAALVVGAGLGSAYDLVIGDGVSSSGMNVVVLDPLVFGTEADQQ